MLVKPPGVAPPAPLEPAPVPVPPAAPPVLLGVPAGPVTGVAPPAEVRDGSTAVPAAAAARPPVAGVLPAFSTSLLSRCSSSVMRFGKDLGSQRRGASKLRAQQQRRVSGGFVGCYGSYA